MERRSDKFYAKINQLFTRTLMGGSESTARWRAVSELRGRGCTLVFHRAEAWSTSTSPRVRETSAQVLCQLRLYRRRYTLESNQLFVEQSYSILARMLQNETNKDVLLAIVYGFGFLYLPAAVPLIVPFATHPDADLRHAATFALGSFHDDPQAIAALSALMEDSDREIRDWAIFGVGTQGNADSKELREAFVRHLTDPYFHARLEAIESLSKRGDLRVVQPLLAHLRDHGDVRSLCEATGNLLHEQWPRPERTAEECIAALGAAFPEQVARRSLPNETDSRAESL